ncbi:MAG: CHAP domain-containing protein [Planctomycetota bacterium]
MTRSDDRRKRIRLAAIAQAEAERDPAGDANRAGPEIERYLGLFRETMNRRAGTEEYSDTSFGYDWCGAFAYYCCLEAGFAIAPEPSEHVNGSLAAVRTWHEWASLPGSGLLVARSDGAEVGDIILFDRLLEDRPLDHLGIVVGVEPEAIITGEGNVRNRAGIFRRPVDGHVNSFVRLTGC